MDHVAGVENLMVAMAAYEAACQHWPDETITLRQGARIIDDSRKEGLVPPRRPRSRLRGHARKCRAVAPLSAGPAQVWQRVVQTTGIRHAATSGS